MEDMVSSMNESEFLVPTLLLVKEPQTSPPGVATLHTRPHCTDTVSEHGIGRHGERAPWLAKYQKDDNGTINGSN